MMMDHHGDVDDDDHGARHVGQRQPEDERDEQQQQQHIINERLQRLVERRQRVMQQHSHVKRGRYRSYTTLSLSAAISYIYYVFYTREQYYPSMVYLASSKLSYVIIGNAWICCMVLTFRAIVFAFLNGGLRDVEREYIGDGLRWSAMEVCLSLTIFREEVTVRMVSMFFTLMLAKSLHWAVELRSGHLQQLDMADHVAQLQHNVMDDDTEAGEDAAHRRNRKKNSHMGFFLLTVLLFVFDFIAVVHCARTCIRHGASVHILFAFQAAILSISALSTLAMYSLHIIDTVVYGRRHRTFHNRGYVTFFLEVLGEGCKFLFYLIYFTIIFTYYGLPINIFRDLYMTYMSLKRKLVSFAKYRRLTNNMSERFRDATVAELQNCGHVCIICRDHMDASSGIMASTGAAKTLPCGHVFHFYCLREWLQQQQTCPTCRAEIPVTTAPAAAAADRNERQGEGLGNHANPAAAAPAEVAAAAPETVAEPVSTQQQQNERTARSSNNVSGQIGVDKQVNKPETQDAKIQAVEKRNDGDGEMTATREKEKKEPLLQQRPLNDDDSSSSSSSPFPCFYRVSNEGGCKVYKLVFNGDGNNGSGSGSHEGPKQKEKDISLPQETATASATATALLGGNSHAADVPSTCNCHGVVRVVPYRKMMLCTDMRWIRCVLPPALPLDNNNDDDNGDNNRRSKNKHNNKYSDDDDGEEQDSYGGGRMMFRMPDGWVVDADVTRVFTSLSSLITTPPHSNRSG